MGWLFYTMLLVCCFSVQTDEAPTWAKLNELNKELEKVESGLSTDDRLKLLLENQHDIMTRLEEIEGKLDGCRPTKPTATATTGVESTSTPSPKNCQDVYKDGGQVSGVYSIFPNGTEEVQVFCEQELQGGGWTLFQRRMDGTVDFYRGWDAYKRGFGSAAGEHWIGNDHLHQLTANQDTQLLVELEHGGETRYAMYREFWIMDEQANYTLHVTGYSGNAGDSLHYHNGSPFTTRDRDNDDRSDNCAQEYSGAWWFYRCYESNLNGRYNDNSGKGVTWRHWTGWITSLSATRMMVK